MKNLKIYKPADVESLISRRKGEVKFGENIQFVEKVEKLHKLPSKYVLLGVPEDIGVRANFGKPGASNAWRSLLKSLMNIQVNRFNNPENLILLGEVECSEFMSKAGNIDTSDPNYHLKLGDIVKELDQVLAEIIEQIISQGKVPITIGGGHNNAYPIIKAAAKANRDPVNVLNIDAHTDLRQLEHRHSGNGFSYAIEGQFLRRYLAFGIHKNYTPEYIFKEMDFSENMKYELAEDLWQHPDKLNERFQQSLDWIAKSKFGLELDCDSIMDFPSSAQSPAGFSIGEIRNFIQRTGKFNNCCYFHICEAAPNEKTTAKVGKALSYFISDFID